MIYVTATNRINTTAVEIYPNEKLLEAERIGTIWGTIKKQDSFSKNFNYVTILDNEAIVAQLWDCKIILQLPPLTPSQPH